jgi:hypothetical protein
MTTIGVITRGKYGKRLIDTLRSKSDLNIVTAELPSKLPEFIDEPDVYLNNLDLDNKVFKADILITYSLHPDLTSEIARIAGRSGVRALIVPGGTSRAPMNELGRYSKEYGIHIEVDDICCSLDLCPETSEFTSIFGRPALKIKTDERKITDVDVIRGAPCGSTWYMAENLIGTDIKDAASYGGLLIQQYPCRAVRGKKGGIHESAELHKKAIEKALEK